MRGMNLGRATAVIAGAFIAAGCRCPPEQPLPECGDVTVNFDVPTDGQRVAKTIAVAAHATDANGQAVEIASAKLQQQLSTDTDFSEPVDGMVSEGGKALFTNVSLPVGTNQLKVTVTKKDNGTCNAVGVVTVVVEESMPTEPPEVTVFNFEGDANNDKTLNGQELAADAKPKALLTVLRGDGCSVSIKDQSNNTVYGTGSVSSGTAAVSLVDLPALPTSMVAEYALKGEVSCPDNRKNDPAVNTAAKVTLTINRAAPTCSLSEPSVQLLGPNGDADAVKNGYQLRAVGAATGATTLEVKLQGGAQEQTTGPLAPVMDGISKDFDVPGSGDVTYVVRLEAKDAVGNLCTATRAVRVDLEKPTLTITQPQNGADAGTFTVPVAITVTGADGQDVVCSRTLVNTKVMNGMVMTTAAFQSGSQTLTCYVFDAAGNRSDDASVTFNVTATGCPLTWSRPASSPAYLTRRDGLVSGMPATLQYQVQLLSSVSCQGEPVRLYRIDNGSRTLLNTGALTSSGTYSYTGAFADTAGAAVRYEAEVDNTLADGGFNGSPTVAPQDIIVDLNSPSLVLPAGSVTMGTPQVYNVNADSNPSVAGVQRGLSVTPALPANTTLYICSTQMPAPAGSPGPCPDGNGGNIVPGGSMLTTNTVATFTFPDGTYGLRPVFVVTSPTNSTNTGDTLYYRFDSVRPAVATATFMNDANADKVLNATEQASGQPTLNLTFTNAPDGSSVTVINRANSSSVGTGTVTSQAASIALTLGLTNVSDESFDFEVRVTSPAPVSNPNNQANATPGTALNPQAFFSLQVDRVAPSCVITSPNVAQLGIADDADNVAMGYQLRTVVQTSSDVGNTGVALSLSGAATQTTTVGPTGGATSVTHDFTVGTTGELDYTIGASCTDAAGNVATATSVQVRVDNVAPTCTLTAPSAANSPYTVTRILPIAVTVGNGNGLNAIISTQVGAGAPQQLVSLPVSAGSAADPVGRSFPDGVQTVTARVTDAAGNFCQSSQTITVTVTSCDIQFTFPAGSPVTLNASNGTVNATNLNWSLTGTASNCPGLMATLYTGTGMGRMQVATTTVTGGNFSFPVSTADGATVHYEVEMNNGMVAVNSRDVTVDITAPVLTNVTPAAATLFYVAPGNRNVDLGTAGYITDTDPSMGAAGAQATIGFNHSGAVGGKAEVLFQNVVVGSINPISAMTPNPAAIAVTLPQDVTAGALVVRLTDGAGNTAQATRTATVDVIAPANPTLSFNVLAGEERKATVRASWAAVGDDDTAGTVTGYDLRWTTALVAPAGLATSADFFDSAKSKFEANVTTLTRDIVMPPLNSYFVYVRAFDEVGNYSDFVSVAKKDNFLAKTTVANPRVGAVACSSSANCDLFGVMMTSRGSLNNDSYDDLVIGYDSSLGQRVFVHYGNPDGGIGNAPQELVGASLPLLAADGGTPGTLASVSFGRGVAMGSVSDSGKADLLIASPGAAAIPSGTNGGAATLFFGTNAAQLDTSAANMVQFRGTVAAGFLGRALAIIDDINGDGYSEVVLSATGEDGTGGDNFRGTVYLFYGRSVAAWRALAGCSTVCTPILMTSADRKFRGPTPPTPVFVPPITLTAGLWGRRGTGFINFGRSGVGTHKDFGIPGSFEGLNKLYLFSGATVNAAPMGTTFTTGLAPTTPDQSMQQLGPTPNPNNNEGGFSVSAVGNIDIVGAVGSADLVAGYAAKNNVYVLADRTANGFATNVSSPTFLLQGPSTSNFGWATQVFDLTGDMKGDIVVGGYVPFVPNAAAPTGVWLFQNRGVAGSEFDQDAATGFNVSRISGLNTGSSLGSAIAVGDFNGDGKLDFAASDHLDGVGKVFVWQ